MSETSIKGSQPSVAEAASDAVGRRDAVTKLLGTLGIAALTGCGPELDAPAAQLPAKDVDTLQASLSGSEIKWVSTVLALASNGARLGDLATQTDVNLFAKVVIAQGCNAPGDGGGGIFCWSESGTDDGGTFIVPNGTVGTTGAGWRRLHGGALSVRWFGAKGNGEADDTVAIQTCINVALAAGGDVQVPPGYYRVMDTLHVGLPVWNDYAFMVQRTSNLTDTDFVKYRNQDNVDRNKYSPPINLIFSAGAYLVPGWIPVVPTPVLAYNLQGNYAHPGGIYGLAIIGSASYVGGKYRFPDFNVAPATNNLIGLVAASGAKLVERPFFSYLHYGILGANNFWTRWTDIKAEYCTDCVHLTQANAMKVDNTVCWQSGRGIIFDGANSEIAGIHTEVVREDLTVLFSDGCHFGPGYLEDHIANYNSGSGEGKYAITLGSVGDGQKVLHTEFRGLRISAVRPGKKAFLLRDTRRSVFTACRAYGKTVDTDSLSSGVLNGCDFDVPGTKWAHLSDYVRPNYIKTKESTHGLARIIASHSLTVPAQSVAAGASAIVPLDVPGTVVGNNMVKVTPSSGIHPAFTYEGRITATDKVSVTFVNRTAGTVTLEGIVSVVVISIM